jgi:gamma-glutamyltranspeptidase/glutathione hydrolase
VAGLLSKQYANDVRGQIHPSIAKPSSEVKPGNPWPFDFPYESKETTHFTVMDKEGNAVSSTQTINTEFGSGVVAEGTGIVMNNEMDDFSAKPGASNAFGAVGSENNSIAPQKRPLSSMSPTIIFRNGNTLMALGTPSGTRIITCVAQTILNYFEHKMPLFESVSSLRYHHQWSPDVLRVDPPGFPAPLEQKLRAMGHSVRTSSLGCQVNAIAKEGIFLHGVSDPRGEGMSYGQ